MNKNKISSFLTNQIVKDKTPSVQYLIFDQDRILHSFQSGFADIKSQRKVDKQTTYNAFSTTKTFTALAILQLAEKDQLDIENSVKQYLTDFPYLSDITIRHLLSHTAGIPNPIPLNWIHLESEHNTFDSNNFFNSIFLKKSKNKFKPGEKFAYSNLGYVILGQIIEKISDRTYENYIRENIIQPLNLGSDELDFEIHEKSAYAKGYQKRGQLINLVLKFFLDTSKYLGKKEGNWYPWNAYYVNGPAYGGLIGTPNAFVKYIQELLNPDCILISKRYKKMLFEENYLNAGNPSGMCLSWFKGHLNGKEYYTHAGGGGGYYCEIRIYPTLKMGSIIMFNRSGMKDVRILDKVDIDYL